jgi:large subunit ribosomal protein L25
METIKLAAQKRDLKIKPRQLRLKSLIPAVIYGKGIDNRVVTVDYNSFAKVLKTAGESSLIDLDIESDGVTKVLVKDTQVEPVTNRFTHIDFFQVNLKEKLRAEILLTFIGESPAVKEMGGSLVRSLGALKVECLPTDLVHEITVDVSVLKAFGDMIRAKDLVLPKGIVMMENPEAAVVAALAPMTEDQLKAMEGAPAAADVAAIKTEAETKKAAEDAKKATEEAAKEAAK